MLQVKFNTIFRGARFLTTVADLADLPRDSVAEVAFVGRSNAGKSSAINALADHTRLAYVSKTPGRTQHLNYFTVADSMAAGRYFVDLPGYGFAKAPGDIRDRWDDLLGPYLLQRTSLSGIVLIMDVRHPLTERDRQMLDWFAPTGKPIHILLSKSDKLTQREQAAALREVRQALEPWGAPCTVQLFSSLKHTGLKEAEAVLAQWLQLELPDRSKPRHATPPKGAEKLPQGKRGARGEWPGRS